MLVAWNILDQSKCCNRKASGGNVLWVLGALWSPESAFYVTAIWWPLYLFDRRVSGSLTTQLVAMLRAAGQLCLLAILTVVAAILVYRIAYGIFPVLRYFLVYALYPPGPLPIDPRDDLVFQLVMVLSVSVSWANWLRTGR